jgi:hypothetical protein
MRTHILLIDHATGESMHWLMPGRMTGPAARKAAYEHAQRHFPAQDIARYEYRPIVSDPYSVHASKERWAIVFVF